MTQRSINNIFCCPWLMGRYSSFHYLLYSFPLKGHEMIHWVSFFYVWNNKYSYPVGDLLHFFWMDGLLGAPKTLHL